MKERFFNDWKRINFGDMETQKVKIDSDKLSQSMREFIREKAIAADSTIVYKENNNLVEENPATGEKKILKTYAESIKV